MLGKSEGRKRVHKVLARSGYGKGGSAKAAEHAAQQMHSGIAEHYAKAQGAAPKKRMDRKKR